MNKTAIRKFAEWAREKLIEDIKYKAGIVGITENGIAEKLPQSTSDTYFYDVGTKDYTKISGIEIKQRDALVKAIQTKERCYKSYQEAFENVIEEVAYTWFNRLIAIRFMEVNDYLPSGVCVLSSENKAKKEPDLVTTPFDTDLEFTSYEQDRIIQLKDDNKLDELFRMLFIKQCNKLHDILPELFEKTDDYSELLLTISFTDPEGIIHHLINDIEDVDFRINDEMYTDDGKIKADGQVEIIGWLYQYYISKKHDEIVNIYKGTVKKADIPAATQLFTTDWVVRYMVDNSLGRYWIERNPQSKLAEKLEFFVTPKNGEIQYVDEKISPTDLTFFDPCMGSGHILVYAFDVLMEIYREVGYSDRDAAVSIVENNLFGMDIDKRAYQLAYFAVMMKARSYNRRALTKGIYNNLAVVEESNSVDKFICNGLTTDSEQNKIGEYLVEAYKDAQEIGTLQTIEKKDYNGFVTYLNNIDNSAGQIDLFSTAWLNDTLPQMVQLAKQAEIMSNKYAVVCTNPPYMNKLEGQLKKFVVDNYKAYSGDLFSVFIYRNFDYCKIDGYSAFMTLFVWLFIKTYEALRKYIIDTKAITTLVQMEYSAFEEATVPICSFVLKNGRATEKALCFRLSDFKGGMEVQKQKDLEAIENKKCGCFYEAGQNDFRRIPGSPLAYWATEAITEVFQNSKLLTEIANPRQGLITGDVNRFVRKWYECSLTNLNLSAKISDPQRIGKWFPYCNGGAYRKWYGNNIDVVDWSESARENYEIHGGLLQSKYWNVPAITWNDITSGASSYRIKPEKSKFSSVSPTLISKDYRYDYTMLGFLNSVVCSWMNQITNPTIHTLVGNILQLPDKIENTDTTEISKSSVDLCRIDWDSFETSWDFTRHPFIKAITKYPNMMDIGNIYLAECYDIWAGECEERFEKLKANEEELNRIFIDIYGLQDELTPEVEDKDVTVRKADLCRDVRSFISYAVGCMFGRYSPTYDGLAYAGGTWDDGKYNIYKPDADGIIPICDDEYFEDDMMGRFVEFVRVVYGDSSLEDNLRFIANALGGKGQPKEVIRNYFLNDFYADHCKIYQKRPIYWLFDSGKKNGFKCLIYLHRYQLDTIARIRTDYVHEQQARYRTAIEGLEKQVAAATSTSERVKLTKQLNKVQAQDAELHQYEEKVHALADQMIKIDLDDGVKHNYEIFKDVLAKIK